MAFNRLLRFHIVRSTRPCVFIPACFLGQSEYRIRRDASHRKEHPNYPDPEYYLNFTQKYFLRHESLRHLRVEQFNRYLWMSGQKGSDLSTLTTAEDTIEDRAEDADDVDENHKNFDEFMESLAPGAHFLPIVKDLPGCKRRSQLRLGISRVPTIEPIGASREMFYEAKLLLALPWFCSEIPQVRVDDNGRSTTEWTFQCKPPVDSLQACVFKLGGEQAPSFEVLCQQLESKFCSMESDIVCKCCAGELERAPCRACKHATGFHRCRNPTNVGGHTIHRWRKGTLFAGTLDIQRVLFNLHRKMLPDHALEAKAKQYVDENLIDKETAERALKCIRLERGTTSFLNDGVDQTEDGTQAASTTTKLNPEELRKLLHKRVEMMKAGKGGDGITDQYRVYCNIIHEIEAGTSYLRMMVQASAGTGKALPCCCCELGGLSHAHVHTQKSCAPVHLVHLWISIVCKLTRPLL